MRRCTRARATSATRKLAAALVVTLALAGCSTPGPMHRYALASPTADTIRDSGETDARDIPSFVQPGERVTGFTYDPFTDHFFLRLAPGNHVRVVDRPARAIKREFTVAELPVTGGGDIAVRPRSGHLYFIDPTKPALIETSRLCEFVRALPLPDLGAPALGVAYDATRDQLLVLAAGTRASVTTRALDGTKRGEFFLARPVQGPLAFDAEKRELYAGALEGGFLIFDERGNFLRRADASAPSEFLDLGPRSFLRVF